MKKSSKIKNLLSLLVGTTMVCSTPSAFGVKDNQQAAAATNNPIKTEEVKKETSCVKIYGYFESTSSYKELGEIIVKSREPVPFPRSFNGYEFDPSDWRVISSVNYRHTTKLEKTIVENGHFIMPDHDVEIFGTIINH